MKQQMNLNTLAILLGLTLGALLSGCKTPKPVTEDFTQRERVLPIPPPIKPAPKNIILLIGDGMGMGQISAGTYANGNQSNLEKFPIVGIHKPHASDNLITDSAAAATAFACGVKTYNAAIAVDANKKPVQSILEEAEGKNMKTGLVSTSTIVHATPASFIAHNEYRKNYEAIAEDFLQTDIDFFAGGGKKYFDRREKDDRNLLEELRAKGYTVEDYLSESPAIKMKLESADKFAYLASDDDPLPVYQGRDYFVDMSMDAINFLSNKSDEEGFFLMIESAQIDWGGHANNAEYIIEEFKEFNHLIGKVHHWASADGETLVIITADHETGGFTIQKESTMDSLVTTFTSVHHTGDFIPVFAIGPGSENFSGLYENTAIYHKMRKALGWPTSRKY